MTSPKGTPKSNYSQSYKTVSRVLYKANKNLIDKWAQDTSNSELAYSCKMLIDAAQAQ